MANEITADGLSTRTYSETLTILKGSMQSIYGTDINLESNTPDGQRLGIEAQMVTDMLALDKQVYSSFDPDQAIGTTLDARCALNGVRRKAGTYSTTDITVVVNQALSLVGVDDKLQLDGTEFTISDNAGTKWVLANSVSPGAGGSYVYVFRAVNTGSIKTSANTINLALSIVIGVLSVNNPSAQLTIGIDEETDAQLKIRRQKSVAIASQGFTDGLEAALLNISGVTSAKVYENRTGSTNGDGVPSHCIWAVVQGGSDADIGKAIYAKRNSGCNMYGAESVTVIRTNGLPFLVNFDRVSSEDVYIQFVLNTISDNLTITGNTTSGSKVITNLSSIANLKVGMPIRGTGIPNEAVIQSLDSSTQLTTSINSTATNTGTSLTIVPINAADMKASIADELTTTVNEVLDINRLSTLIQGINPTSLVTSSGFSLTDGSYTNTLANSAKNKQFSVSTPKIRIL